MSTSLAFQPQGQEGDPIALLNQIAIPITKVEKMKRLLMSQHQSLFGRVMVCARWCTRAALYMLMFLGIALIGFCAALIILTFWQGWNYLLWQYASIAMAIIAATTVVTALAWVVLERTLIGRVSWVRRAICEYGYGVLVQAAYNRLVLVREQIPDAVFLVDQLYVNGQVVYLMLVAQVGDREWYIHQWPKV